MPCIVDLNTGQVVPQKGRAGKLFTDLRRIDMPDGAVINAASVGHVHPPQYSNLPEGETNPPPRYKVHQEQVVIQGSGSVASDSEPVYDSLTGTVTVTRTLRAAPPSPTAVELAESEMINSPVWRGLVKRIAAAEGKTARQVMDEIKAGA